MQSTSKWGIIGLGKIAHNFAKDLMLVPEAELCAVASTSLERAKEFAHQFHAKAYYGNYDELFSDPTIEIIYIATLHPDHFEWSIKAMKHGKSVLCEKPLGMNRHQVATMIATAKAEAVFFMEALWTRFNPAYVQTRKWIAAGKIGAIRYINASFSFYALDRGSDSRILNLEKGGGALLDIGIYPVFLAYSILGIPSRIHSSAIQLNNGVDVQNSMIFDYPEAQAVLHSSFSNNEQMTAKICGTDGEFYLGPRWHEAQTLRCVQKEKEVCHSFELLGRGYSYEIQEAHKCLQNNVLESDLWSHQNSLDMAKIMDAIREQCGIYYPSDNQK